MAPKLRKTLKNLSMKVNKVITIIGKTPVEKVELVAYQLKGFAQVLFNNERNKGWWERVP